MSVLIGGQTQLHSIADSAWVKLLDRVPHDIYHTPTYHSLPGFGNRGEACAFSYCEGENTFLWPYLL